MGVKKIVVVTVPGAFEIAFAIKNYWDNFWKLYARRSKIKSIFNAFLQHLLAVLSFWWLLMWFFIDASFLDFFFDCIFWLTFHVEGWKKNSLVGANKLWWWKLFSKRFLKFFKALWEFQLDFDDLNDDKIRKTHCCDAKWTLNV